MATELGKKASVLFLGAAALSLLIPRPWRPAARAPDEAAAAPRVALPPVPAPGRPAEARADSRAEARAEPPVETRQEAARPPRRMWALVQTKPETLVLAVSASRAELERELAELNETWNHWELRVERQRYAIQPAPILYAP
ncbi:MAG TPA: hypothetical protein VIL72_05855, partial [Beijerinckiaceae bacterium]